MMAERAGSKELFRALVLAVMVGCIAWSVVEFLRSLVPGWNGTFLVVGCVLAALQACYSYRLLRTRWALRFSATSFRAAELGVIFVLLKVGSYLDDEWAEVIAEVQSWPANPLGILDAETMVAFGLAFLAWLAVNQTLADLERVGEPPDHDPGYMHPLESIMQRFFGGGLLLLITSGLTLTAISEALDLERPSVPGLVLNALIYFLLGLAMLGQVQLERLRRYWKLQETQVAANLGSRWRRYSLGLVGLAALAAFVLPTGFAFSLLSLARTAIIVAAYVVSVAVTLLYMLCGLPFGWILSQFSGEAEQPDVAPLEAPPAPPPAVVSEVGGGPDWLAILRVVLFWVVTLGITFYLLRRYLRDRPELVQGLLRLRPVGALRRAWTCLWRWLRLWTARLGQSVSERLPRRLLRLPRPGVAGGMTPDWLRLRGLSPREKVRRYYLNVLRRAGQHGLGRERNQTPYEYQATLEADLAQVRPEVEGLTQAFVEARYSRGEVEPEAARGARAYWARIKAALRGRK